MEGGGLSRQTRPINRIFVHAGYAVVHRLFPPLLEMYIHQRCIGTFIVAELALAARVVTCNLTLIHQRNDVSRPEVTDRDVVDGSTLKENIRPSRAIKLQYLTIKQHS